MHTFKINAGIPSAAQPLGGWEDPQCGLRGHFVGHFLSACSKLAFADRDGWLKSKAEEIVDIMAACAQPNGYLSAFEEEKLDILEREENRNVWAPYYTLHKIMQGLIDCHLYLHNVTSLNLALNLATYIHGRFEKLSFWKMDGILRCTKVNPVNEFGGIGDSLYTLYDITGDTRLFELGGLFDREYFIGHLEAGMDVLENLHANTHLPMVIAAMHRFAISGEAKYKKAAVRFYEFVGGRTFANGNNSSKATEYIAGGVSEKSEHWGRYGMLGDALTGGESESCCAHNTERILERLIEWSGSVQHLNHLETLKYNAVLNSSSAQTGLSQYHQLMGSGAVKKFSDPYDSFWCCTASGIEAMSEIQKNIWFKNDGVILVNALISSAVDWKERNVRITQVSGFPDKLTSTLKIEATEPVSFKLMLKADAVKAVTVNSGPITFEQANGFIVIERMFHDQDKIDIEIDANMHLIPLQGAEGIAAVMYGPVLLARIGPNRPVSGLSERNLNHTIIKTDRDRLAFSIQHNSDDEALMIPLFRVEEEEYTVYLDLMEHAAEARQFTYAIDGSKAYKEEA
ncbi:beta-L-arabinofuranosidase domain-containing protein [Paenibacillus methanolicus]|uniref:DUF1680 family protein n=1 Tax=Paenibacillus methanolicus TaxID=582686 RepID=A0A5S5CGK6_9BACL|nr:beta-L-arabinofuranosidase domain-containing protein [Paenibacillus methanolicus]TYP77480.1 hypothetical protein BCM02_10240 [Paenibacillus methanolicus]